MPQNRVLVIVGSGEMSPRMAPVHRSLVQRLADRLGRPVRAVSLDTPYGFQENADHITERTVRYFRDRVKVELEAVRLRRSGMPTDDAAATDSVRRADFVFAGPGSPTYALEHWRASGVGWALREKLIAGGALSVASAAAITVGAFALPVYEIYKAGRDPYWLPGLDILSIVGWRVGVVPHFDNREGGGHDTRFCYLGQRRFEMLESELPDGAWILGIDENTALTLDLDEGTAEVRGAGAVTARINGKSREFRAGLAFPMSELPPTGRRGAAAQLPQPPADPLERAVNTAIDAADVRGAVEATLALEAAAAKGQGSDTEASRQALRSAILRLGDLTARGLSDAVRAETAVDALVSVRSRARDAGDWNTADGIRDALGEAGLTLRDTDAGPVLERDGRGRRDASTRRKP